MMIPVMNLAQIKLLKLLSNDSSNILLCSQNYYLCDLGLTNQFVMSGFYWLKFSEVNVDVKYQFT